MTQSVTGRREGEERAGIGSLVVLLDSNVANYRSDTRAPVVLTTVLGSVVSGGEGSGRGGGRLAGGEAGGDGRLEGGVAGGMAGR